MRGGRHLARLASRAWLVVIAPWCTACSDDGAVEAAPAPAECTAPNRLLGDGRCISPGVQDDGCAAGERMLDGQCRAAGLAPEDCAEGFLFDTVQGSCEPVLPPGPCPPGQMAIPGEAACRPVAACGAGKWGDIPVEPSSVYVDAAFVGPNADGTVARPFPTIGQAVVAAPSGALVAVAAGSYVEDVALAGKALRLWGVCPALVEVVGTGAEVAALFLVGGAGGSEAHGMAVRGPAFGVGMTGAGDVALDSLWIHDTGGPGMVGDDVGGPASIALRNVLIEHCVDVGIGASGADVALDGVVIRATQPRPQTLLAGRGVNLTPNPFTGRRPSLIIGRSLIEQNRDTGVFAMGTDVSIAGSATGMTNRQEVKVRTGARRREPDTDETRATTWSTRPLPRRSPRRAREGLSGGSHRCTT